MFYILILILAGPALGGPQEDRLPTSLRDDYPVRLRVDFDGAKEENDKEQEKPVSYLEMIRPLPMPPLPQERIELILPVPAEQENAWDRTAKLPRLLGDAVETFLIDIVYLLGAPGRMSGSEWLMSGLAFASVGGAMAVDEDVRQLLGDPKSKAVSHVSQFFTDLGGTKYGAPLLGTAVLWGIADYVWTGDTYLRDGILTAAESALIAGIFAQMLKRASGRSRPGDEQGPYDFHFFKGKDSFPSGHASSSFAIAAALDGYFDSPVPEIAYTVATLVAVSRLIEDKHHFSDVFAGAFLGWVIGDSISGRHLKNEKSSWRIGPSWEMGAPVFAFEKDF